MQHDLAQSFFPVHKLPSPVMAEMRFKMQSTQYSSERYTDRGSYAVMTRTTVLKDTQLARISDHLRRNAEDLVSSSNPPSTHDCRIAGAMLGFALELVPLRIGAKFDY